MAVAAVVRMGTRDTALTSERMPQHRDRHRQERIIMKDLKTIAVLCLASLVVCVPRATARAEGHHQSGIVGWAVWLTSWPVPAQTPVHCFFSVVTESGKSITTLETDANGSFRVALKPGTYLLTLFWPLDGEGIITGPTQRVTVEKKNYTVFVMRFGPSSPGWPSLSSTSSR